MILEPDRPMRALVAEWLEMEDYGLLHAPDVATAAQVASQCDVRLLDIPATLRSAREIIACLTAVVPRTPIIAMSADVLASGPSGAAAVARELGVAAVLVKPFGRDALTEAMERVRTST